MTAGNGDVTAIVVALLHIPLETTSPSSGRRASKGHHNLYIVLCYLLLIATFMFVLYRVLDLVKIDSQGMW